MLWDQNRPLRTDEETIANLKAKGQHPITYKEGLELAKKIDAQKYVECSAKTENLEEVFIEIKYFESKSKVKTFFFLIIIRSLPSSISHPFLFSVTFLLKFIQLLKYYHVTLVKSCQHSKLEVSVKTVRFSP